MGNAFSPSVSEWLEQKTRAKVPHAAYDRAPARPCPVKCGGAVGPPKGVETQLHNRLGVGQGNGWV